MPGASSNVPIILGFGLAVAAVSVGVWGAKGTRGLNGFGGRRTTRYPRQLRGPTEAHELQLYCENDGQLYDRFVKPYEAQLDKKIKKGIFDRTKAEKGWMFLAESCAKKYVKEFGSPGQAWHSMFSVADRREVAKNFNDSYMSERKLT